MHIKFWGTRGAYPTDQQMVSLQIQADDFTLLVDAGSPRLFVNIQHVLALNAVLLTHLHHDHITMLPHLILARLKTLKGCFSPQDCPIYAPEDPISVIYDLSVEPELLASSTHIPTQLGNLSIQSCQAQHPIKAHSYRFEHHGKSIVISGDTAYHPGLSAFSQGADLLICECTDADNNRNHALRFGHMTPADVARLASEAGIHHIVLYHYMDLAPDKASQAVQTHLGNSFSVIAAMDEMEIDTTNINAPLSN